MSAVVERATAAVMAEVKRQMGGKQIPGTPDERFWSATSWDEPVGVLDFRLIVLVVVAALREPDEAMIMAAVDQWATREEAITIWATMIDTAAMSAPQAAKEEPK